MINLVVCEHMICQYGETYVVKESLNKHDAEVKRKTIDEFISKAEEERDDILNWDDDEYENGMRCGYQYSIEIAEKMKGKKE